MFKTPFGPEHYQPKPHWIQNTIASGTKKNITGETHIRELFVEVLSTFRKRRPAGFSFDKSCGWSDWEYTEL